LSRLVQEAMIFEVKTGQHLEQSYSVCSKSCLNLGLTSADNTAKGASIMNVLT